MLHFVQTIRRHKDRTGVSSDSQSAFNYPFAHIRIRDKNTYLKISTIYSCKVHELGVSISFGALPGRKPSENGLDRKTGAPRASDPS